MQTTLAPIRLVFLTALIACSIQAAPVITGVTNAPSMPTAADPVWVTAQVTGAVSIASATLTYGTGTGINQTNTVLLETMATNEFKPWYGTNGCDYAWTVSFSGSNPFQQNSNANHGTGNPCGLTFKNGTVNLSNSMITTVKGIDARGLGGTIGFSIQTSIVSSNAGWAMQLNPGTGFTTRLGEITSTTQTWQTNSYGLLPGDLVSNLIVRFQFSEGDTNNRIFLDQIFVQVATGGSSWTNTAMYDDGNHGDGMSADGIYGAQIPALPAGTTVNYYLTATDSGGLSSANPAGAPGINYSYTVTSNAVLPVIYDLMLGRPTDTSIAVSVLASNDLQVYFEYGTQSGVYAGQTATNSITNAVPAALTIGQLQGNQRYYYRMRYSTNDGASFGAGAERTFVTQRTRGSTFIFDIEADPHYNDNPGTVTNVWQQTLTNILADQPDFLIDLGDTFMGEKYAPANPYTLTQQGILDACAAVRSTFFNIPGHSVPLFLVNGNHDPELGWLLVTNTPHDNPAVWGASARKLYYPSPIPGGFYSGATNNDYYQQEPRDGYYAFEWGDALFVMIDPFWYSSQGVKKSKDPWAWTLGTNQYYWLKSTLENSTAKFKFVFGHHLVGGDFGGLARGGLEFSPYFEWGGYNTNGTWGFTTNRPGWPMPIQSLLLSNGVNAFFHGHDHLYVKQDYYAGGVTNGNPDLIYQEVPQPSHFPYDATGSATNSDYNYTNGVLYGSSGHLRVTVSPTNATVDYVRSYRPSDLGPGKTNRMVSYSYAFSALALTETTNQPAAPSPTNSVWVTCRVSGSTNLGQITLTYDAGAGPTNVTMFDDGVHQDGGSGDGVYGAEIPALPDGTTVHYYVRATYDLNRQAADPGAAPAQSYSYIVSSPVAVTPLVGSIVLGRPTAHSITVSVLSSNDYQMYLEYGLSPGAYPYQTAVTNITAGWPREVILNQLQPDSRYYYRLRYKTVGDPTCLADAMHAFHTQRAPGSAFIFEIMGDSHPERASQFTSSLYTNTLLLAAADQPDFYMAIGDDFSVDTIPTNSIDRDAVTGRYILQRPYLGLVANSASLFLVNGNHEQAAQYLLDGTSNNVAVWAGNARNLYYPMPAPDGFYTGDAEPVPFVGLPCDYYAWTWGDALFVTLDPYWHCPLPVDNVYGGAAKRTNWWDVTHGDVQSQWLKTTLEQSKARYKFVFAHHVLGSGRGGTEEAPLYEWGGQNANGTWGFTTNRPTWPLPIHQLMVANNVTAFIQGHDHIFVRQQLDGVTYLELPEPADPNYALYNDNAYVSIYETNNTGRVRFNVFPDYVKIEYVRSYLPADEGPGKTNNMVDYSFVIFPLVVAGTTNTPAAPTATDLVWVTATVTGGTNLSQVTLTCIVGGSTNTMAMLDDGAHHDGAEGDGVYGAQIPAFAPGTMVRYYVRAQDAASRQITDPSGAPVNPNMFSYTVAGVPPTVLSGEWFPEGKFRLQFGVYPGADYIVQATDYLTNPIPWVALLTTNSGTNLVLFFDDLQVTNRNQRFYRVVAP
jgi:phosphodiesterase/alkaline phosphatase D-like protein